MSLSLSLYQIHLSNIPISLLDKITRANWKSVSIRIGRILGGTFIEANPYRPTDHFDQHLSLAGKAFAACALSTWRGHHAAKFTTVSSHNGCQKVHRARVHRASFASRF